MTTILNSPDPAAASRPQFAPALAPLPAPVAITQSVGLRDLLNTLFYYRRTALFVWEAIVLLGILAVLLIPPSYTARARLLTLSGGVYELQPGNPNDARIVTPLVAVDVEQQILSSPELHRAVLAKIAGPGLTGDAFEQRFVQFENRLHISKLETGNVLELTFRDRDPQQAAAVLRALLSAYFDERARVLTSGRVEFLRDQSDKTKAQLDQANAQIEAYEKEHGVVDVAEQINGAVALDSALRDRLTEADSAVADATRSTAALIRGSRDVPREVQLFTDNTEAAHTLGLMQADLFNLQVKRADLASRYMVTSPFVKQIDAQIGSLQRSIDEQSKHMTVSSRTGYNSFHDTVTDRITQAEATLAGAEGRRSVLKGQMASSAARLKELIGINDTIARLTAQRDLLAGTAKDYAQQLEQARIQQNQATTSGTTNVRVIEQPEPPRKRTNPPLLFLLATALAGLLIVAVTVVVLNSLRETFLTPDDAERALRLPVLCDIAPRNRRGAPARRSYGRLIGALDSAPATGGAGRAVLLLAPQDGGKVNLLAQGLAEALEPRSPGRVLLVKMTEDAPDSDPTAPASDGSLSVGMTMTRARLTELFSSLRGSYDYVVVTAPPASASFESLELTTVADLSVLVVSAENTRKAVAETVLAQAASIGGSIAGLSMTGRRYYIPSWLYRTVLGRGIA